MGIKADIHSGYIFHCVEMWSSFQPVQTATLLPSSCQEKPTKTQFPCFSFLFSLTYSLSCFLSWLCSHLSCQQRPSLRSFVGLQTHSPSSLLSKSRLARKSFLTRAETTPRLYTVQIGPNTSIWKRLEVWTKRICVSLGYDATPRRWCPVLAIKDGELMTCFKLELLSQGLMQHDYKIL